MGTGTVYQHENVYRTRLREESNRLSHLIVRKILDVTLKETPSAEPTAQVSELEFDSGYPTPAERLATPVHGETYVRGVAFSSGPRMR